MAQLAQKYPVFYRTRNFITQLRTACKWILSLAGKSTATVFTDSRITLDSLYKANNHAYLIEEIRKKIIQTGGH